MSANNPQTAKKGCRLCSFECEREGVYYVVHDRAQDMKKGRKMRPYMPFCLRFFDSANRTLCCASTTIYAEISRNFKFAVAFADSLARANTLATAASNTFISDFVSHGRLLLFLLL